MFSACKLCSHRLIRKGNLRSSLVLVKNSWQVTLRTQQTASFSLLKQHGHERYTSENDSLQVSSNVSVIPSNGRLSRQYATNAIGILSSNLGAFQPRRLGLHFTRDCLRRGDTFTVAGSRPISTSQKQTRQETVMNVFDREAKRKQRDRAAMAEDVAVYDYLKDEIAYRMVDRVRDITRKFPVAVDLGCGRGLMANYLTEDEVETLYQCEMSGKMLEQAPSPEGVNTIKMMIDEEFIPFKEESLDLVISSLSLHWVNDLPGTLRQVHKALKKDGAFIGAMFGGDTLFELRCSLQIAETEKEGGFAPHISPFTDMQDLGNLMSRSGFNMLTIDIEEVQVNYPSMYELMKDLKGMGESNAAWSRKNYLRRETTAAAAQIYKDMYGNEDGSVPATFQVLFMIGWKPDESQAQPAARGSATASLKDLDKLNQDVPPQPK